MSTGNSGDLDSESAEDQLWQQVYEVRRAEYEAYLGPLPDDILKMGNLFGVWPGGGLFVIPAAKLGESVWVYTTFGLTNPDMPATTTTSQSSTETDALGRPTSIQSTLQRKENGPAAVPGRPGYGYELMVVARENAEWPLWLLQWAVNAELLSDVDFLGRVEQYNGLTVEDISIGAAGSANLFITKAQPPLPTGFSLPNGPMDILVATVITDDEMQFSLDQGRPALAERLQSGGVQQISDLNRPSVLAQPGVSNASLESAPPDAPNRQSWWSRIVGGGGS